MPAICNVEVRAWGAGTNSVRVVGKSTDYRAVLTSSSGLAGS